MNSSIKIVFILVIATVFSWSSGVSAVEMPTPRSDLTIPRNNIHDLLLSRENATNRVKLVKKYFKDQQKVMMTSEIMYGNAKSNFNAWVEELIFCLNSHCVDEQKDKNNVSLKKALLLSDDFIKYVDQEIDPKLGIPKGVASFATFLQKAAPALKDLYNWWVKAEENDRDQLRKELKNMKWLSFDDISSN